MMKRLLLMVLFGMFCVSGGLNAMNALQNSCINFGQFLENVNVPIIGKLTNILPFQLVATSFKQCPKQTMLVLMGALLYALSYNEYVRVLFRKYKAMGLARLGIKPYDSEYDETLFIFDGEDEEDAEEEMEMEDELLEDSSDEEYNDIFRDEKEIEKQQQPIIKFL